MPLVTKSKLHPYSTSVVLRKNLIGVVRFYPTIVIGAKIGEG